MEPPLKHCPLQHCAAFTQLEAAALHDAHHPFRVSHRRAVATVSATRLSAAAQHALYAAIDRAHLSGGRTRSPAKIGERTTIEFPYRGETAGGKCCARMLRLSYFWAGAGFAAAGAAVGPPVTACGCATFAACAALSAAVAFSCSAFLTASRAVALFCVTSLRP